MVACRFEVERFAGSGAMGLVYRARDTKTGEWVAIKVLAHGSADRFLREARALAEVEHPHIVRYVDHGRTDAGEPYLAMEWLDGSDLAEKLLAGPLPMAKALGLTAAVARALSVAHVRGVVHRDVKPSNLFLSDGDPDNVKVLDFGAARFVQTTSAPTASGIVLGTPGYLAPEQVHDDHPVDGRADVFALGCVLFECLTGRPAFVAQHVLALLGKILRENPPALRELVPDAPVALEQLLTSMLAKDPNARPADMIVIAETLARVAVEAARSARDDSSEIAGPLVFRWWSVEAADHFYTTDASGERAMQCGYIYEGVGFRTLREGAPGAAPLFRWYSRAGAEHFYTTDPGGEDAPATGYEQEGVLGLVATAPLPGTVALHRWWNAAVADHFYTTHPAGELAPQLGYTYQGVAGYVLPAQAKLAYGMPEEAGGAGREASSDRGAAAAAAASPDEAGVTTGASAEGTAPEEDGLECA
jgi:tRNA A-37 threonylcarbamoyl transferase component Bud32